MSAYSNSRSSSTPTTPRHPYKTLNKRSPKSPSEVNIRPVNIDVRPKISKQKAKCPLKSMFTNSINKKQNDY